MSGKIDSRIQMPKGILKRFTNDHKKLFHYDVDTGYIGQGYPKTWNTSPNYYDSEMEQFLCHNIEDTICKIVDYIETHIDDNPFQFPKSQVENIRRYFNSLIARSPKLHQETLKNMLFPHFFSEQNNHILTVLIALKEIEKENMFDDYFVTFIKNNSKMPFVLPIMGMYAYKNESDNGMRIIMPLTPQIAILLVERNFANNYIDKNEILSMHVIEDENVVFSHNCCAVKHQISLGYGSVVANRRELLENIKKALEVGS